MISRNQLKQALHQLLSVPLIQDCVPNGLQVQGKENIAKIVLGVTGCQRLLDAAVLEKADAIIVHHGYFWKGEPSAITGLRYQRLSTLLCRDINLFAYHLPLDIHPTIGNNVQFAKALGIVLEGSLETIEPSGLVLRGYFTEPVGVNRLSEQLQACTNQPVITSDTRIGSETISTLAWCTGAGQPYLVAAAEAGLDAFITGEVSEPTIHIARELGIHFFSIGHHASERYGIQALGHWIAQRYPVLTCFIDIPNPA